MTLYENSFVPQHLPGGGGFSIMKFSLNTLYQQHNYVRNWWTASNKELPLVKYSGCKITLYQSDTIDYIFRYQNTFPFTATNLMYASTQPSLMMMMKNSVLVPSTQTKPLRKRKKTIKIRPPPQYMNKWYFQHELLNTGMLLTQCVAASFNEYYQASDAESNNITIYALNTKLFTNRNFHTHETSGYYTRIIDNKKTYLYATDQDTFHSGTQISNIIFLGQTRYYRHGENYSSPHNIDKEWNKWKHGPPEKYWGNPFMHEYIDKNMIVLYSDKPPSEIFNKENSTSPATNLTELSSDIIWKLRYNPNKDNGTNTQAYLLQNFETSNNIGWDPPRNNKLIFSGFPMWVLLWGFLDFQKKQAEVSQIDTHYMLVIQNKTTSPEADYIVPLGYNFTHDKSPYEDTVNPFDKDKWYPMVQYQEEMVNEIVKCGPGTAKLHTVKTGEAHAKYTFYLKFGGNPPPMTTIINPQDQPYYAVPSNVFQTTSLQNPGTPIQYYLSNFDQRRDYLTKSATDRIKKDCELTKTSFTDTGLSMDTSPFHSPIQTPQTSEDETSTEEEKEETLFQQLQLQRRKQKRIRQRILKLLTQIQNIE